MKDSKNKLGIIALIILLIFIAGCTSRSNFIKDNNGEIVGIKLEDDPTYETKFLSIEKTDTTLTAMFYHDAEYFDADATLPVHVEGNVDYMLSITSAAAFEEVDLTVALDKGEIPDFKLHIGDALEVFEFGSIGQLLLILNES